MDPNPRLWDWFEFETPIWRASKSRIYAAPKIPTVLVTVTPNPDPFRPVGVYTVPTYLSQQVGVGWRPSPQLFLSQTKTGGVLATTHLCEAGYRGEASL